MTVAVLRLERVSPCDVDRHLLELGELRLVRTDGGIWLEVADDRARRAVAMIARAGLRAVPVGAPDAPTQGLVPAIVTHLEPLRATGAVDILTLRTIGDGEAITRLARGPFFRWRGDRETIRTILRGLDRAFVWCRAVHATPKALRALRGVRPLVFDRSALDRPEERLAFVGRAALTRWIA